ncbi:hypothetical protein BHE74_00051001 [Ensete ventricosum]|nr:hypothetical protein BHE74_00051001 [Ensete ventricosum]
MKAAHDLDTAVTKGSLAVIRERYSIPTEYGLHVSQPRQHPFSSDAPGMCISVDALEASLWFPLHPLIEECLKWWRISLSQTPFQVVFYPVSWDVDRMDLSELHGIPKVSGGKAPSTRAVAPAREVGTSPARETPKASSKRPIDASTEQVDDPARRPKKVKVLTRRHKSRHGEGESHSRSKSKEPAAPSEELEMPAESDEGGASLVHHRPRSMKDLFKTKVHKDNVGGLKNSIKIWNDLSVAEEFERGLLHPQLARELYTLPLEVLLARAAKEMVLAVAKAEERASELEQELEKTKREWDEVLQRLEASEKEQTEVRSNLAEIQRLLKEARVRAQKMDDELLQSVKALESAQAELPKQVVDRYKESAGFKEGLKRMGRVTYEYGYRVALPRFHALHPDLEVEEDPFTIHPEDDLVPMKRQQAFDDSDPPES